MFASVRGRLHCESRCYLWLVLKTLVAAPRRNTNIAIVLRYAHFVVLRTLVLTELVEIDSALVGGTKRQDAQVLPMLVQLGATTLGNSDLEIGTRGAGWNLIKQLIYNKPTTIERMKLYQPVSHRHMGSFLITNNPVIRYTV